MLREEETRSISGARPSGPVAIMYAIRLTSSDHATLPQGFVRDRALPRRIISHDVTADALELEAHAIAAVQV